MDMSIRFPNLQIYFGYVGRSVSVFGFEITIYGLLIAAGMLLGLLFVLSQARRLNENQNLYLEMLIPALLGGIIGARALYVAFHWELFSGQTAAEICDIRNGGMSLYGGIFGGVLFSALFCRIRKISFERMADTASMGLLIAQIIGVWGNFFNRESFGEYTDSIFAMQIPADVVHPDQITESIERHLVLAGDISYIQVHPLFLYESLWGLVLFLILLIYTRRKTYQGEIFLRYLAGCSLGRIGIEWLRTDALKIPGTDFPFFLPVCVILFIVCGISATVRRILWKKREAGRKRRREERYAAEEKTTRDYDSIQAYENVSEEFWNTEVSEKNTEDEGSAEEPSEKLGSIPENTGDSGKEESSSAEKDGTSPENSREDDRHSQDSPTKEREHRESEEETAATSGKDEEASENGGDSSQDPKCSSPDTENKVVETDETSEPLPTDREEKAEAESDGERSPESEKMS